MTTVSIWGSCVSRDTIDLATTYSGQLEVTSYSARQNWISATSAPIPYPGDNLPSKFQSRMLKGDFESSAISTLIDHEPKSDAIILDLVDDRYPTVMLSNGQRFTLSNEALAAKLRDGFPDQRTTHVGSEEHAQLWVDAAQHVGASLAPFMGKIFVFGGPWAAVDTDGNAVRPPFGRPVEEWNRINAWFMGQLKGLGFNVIELPEELAVSDANHRWGASPFHFIPEAYDYWAGKMLKALDNQEPSALV